MYKYYLLNKLMVFEIFRSAFSKNNILKLKNEYICPKGNKTKY